MRAAAAPAPLPPCPTAGPPLTRPRRRPRRPIDLVGYTVSVVTDSAEFEFELEPLPTSGAGRSWFLRAGSAEERDRWVRALTQASCMSPVDAHL